MKIIFLIFLLTHFQKILCSKNTELVFVQMLFRHGDRSPTYMYQNNPNPDDIWPEGLGKLTILGRKQLYNLGRKLHSMYENFITSNPNEVSVLSTEIDRCIRSAQAALASLYPPDSKWTFEESLNWQPIPIFYHVKEKDKYLYPESHCPRASAERTALFSTQEVQKMNSEYKDLYEKLTFYSGDNVTNFVEAFYLYDCLLIEKIHNFTIPDWVNPYWDELETITENFFYLVYNSPVLHRLRAGPFLERVIILMLKKMAGFFPEKKVEIYSAHDATLAAILSALNLYNMKRPPYAATLIFELHKDINSQQHFIRLLYLNSTHPESGDQPVHTLKLNGCSELCPMDYFLNHTVHLIPEDWESECQEDEGFMEFLMKKKISTGLFLIVMVIQMVLLLLVSCIVWRKGFNKNKRYMESLPL